MTRPVTWVVGAGGLLGSSTARAARRRGGLWSPSRPIPWATPDAGRALRSLLGEFAQEVNGGPWQIAWCAGTGMTASGRAPLAQEEAVLAEFLEDLTGSTLAPASGALFLASSAGAVYAGSAGPPFTEASEPRPLSEYGHSKLRTEAIAARVGTQLGLPIVIGRIGNLFGPGQNLGKEQGLISQLCRSVMLRRPLQTFVPLDTVRDYLFADDAGEIVLDLLDRLRLEADDGRPGTYLKVMCHGHGVTVGFVLAEVGRILKRRPDAVFGSRPQSRWQALDLRLGSVIWPEIDRRPLTPMPVGIARTLEATRSRLLSGDLR